MRDPITAAANRVQARLMGRHLVDVGQRRGTTLREDLAQLLNDFETVYDAMNTLTVVLAERDIADEGVAAARRKQSLMGVNR